MNCTDFSIDPAMIQMLMSIWMQQQCQNMAASQMPNFLKLPISKPKKRRGHKPREGEELARAATLGLPLTRAELAKVLPCSPEKISHWIAQGMPCFYISNRRYASKGSDPRFILSKVQAWLEKDTPKAPMSFEEFMSKYAA